VWRELRADITYHPFRYKGLDLILPAVLALSTLPADSAQMTSPASAWLTANLHCAQLSTHRAGFPVLGNLHAIPYEIRVYRFTDHTFPI
jgi:hypothetical protein